MRGEEHNRHCARAADPIGTKRPNGRRDSCFHLIESICRIAGLSGIRLSRRDTTKRESDVLNDDVLNNDLLNFAE